MTQEDYTLREYWLHSRLNSLQRDIHGAVSIADMRELLEQAKKPLALESLAEAAYERWRNYPHGPGKGLPRWDQLTRDDPYESALIDVSMELARREEAKLAS